MSDYSPYRPPQVDSFETPLSVGAEREPLRQVAKYQRWVIFALLGNVVANIFAFGLGGEGPPVQLAVLVVVIGVVVFAVISIFLLAMVPLLFGGKVSGFGIMSSDSDFMPLAMRIRQEGLPVYGFGSAKTPEAFKQALEQVAQQHNCWCTRDIKDDPVTRNRLANCFSQRSGP